MCEFEKSLITWIDGELDAGMTHQLEHHLEKCEKCSRNVARYREASRAFAAYYRETPVPKSRSGWLWSAAGAAALTAAAAAILLMLRAPVEQMPFPALKTVEAPSIAFARMPASPPAPLKTLPQRASLAHRATSQPAFTGSEPFVEIAIPGDALFAPGALPPGFTFAAGLSISGDGSPRVLRVQPGMYLK